VEKNVLTCGDGLDPVVIKYQIKLQIKFLSSRNLIISLILGKVADTAMILIYIARASGFVVAYLRRKRQHKICKKL